MQEVEYEKYVDMIRAEVWKTIKSNQHMDYDELLSAGNLAFVEATKTWKPELGSFSTHLWYRLRYRVGRTVKNAKRLQVLGFLEDQPFHLAKEGDGFFAAQLSGLSQEAKFVVNLVFTSGVELVDMTARNIKTTRKGIREYLSAEGWPGKMIAQVFDEIKEVVL